MTQLIVCSVFKNHGKMAIFIIIYLINFRLILLNKVNGVSNLIRLSDGLKSEII